MESIYDPDVEASFAEDDEWIAALVRQVFRARQAEDSSALEVTFCYLEDYLTKVLKRHLRYRDPQWEGHTRWFDGLYVTPAYPSPGRFELHGRVAWVIGQEAWHYDPFEFELELESRTGAFRGYVYRFGDHRPLSAKKTRNEEESYLSPVGGWQYEIHRGSSGTGQGATVSAFPVRLGSPDLQ